MRQYVDFLSPGNMFEVLSTVDIDFHFGEKLESSADCFFPERQSHATDCSVEMNYLVLALFYFGFMFKQQVLELNTKYCPQYRRSPVGEGEGQSTLLVEYFLLVCITTSSSLPEF